MPKTLLLVEDEAIIALSEASMLKQNGFAVITVHDAPAAIEAVRSDEVDLVLMDIDLGRGRMNGTEAAERILEDRELPIVFLTSHCEKEMVDKVKGITRYGYVLKNAGEFVLLEAITMAFELFKSCLEIKEKEQHLHLLVENIDDVVYSVDTETEEFDYLSPAFTRLLGYTREDIFRMGGRKEFLGAVILEGAFKEQLKTLKGYKNSRKERPRHIAAWKTKDGSEIILEDNWVVRYKEGVLVKTEGVLRDITDRMHMHEKLRKNELLYRNLMENSIDAIYLLDRAGRILNVNQVACGMTGYSREELLRLTIDDIDPNYPSEKFVDFWNAQPEGSTLLFETLHQNKDGTLRPVEVNGIFFILYGQKYLFGVARDLSGRGRTV